MASSSAKRGMPASWRHINLNTAAKTESTNTTYLMKVEEVLLPPLKKSVDPIHCGRIHKDRGKAFQHRAGQKLASGHRGVREPSHESRTQRTRPVKLKH